MKEFVGGYENRSLFSNKSKSILKKYKKISEVNYFVFLNFL